MRGPIISEVFGQVTHFLSNMSLSETAECAEVLQVVSFRVQM